MSTVILASVVLIKVRTNARELRTVLMLRQRVVVDTYSHIEEAKKKRKKHVIISAMLDLLRLRFCENKTAV
jgi:hypothetical protein